MLNEAFALLVQRQDLFTAKVFPLDDFGQCQVFACLFDGRQQGFGCHFLFNAGSPDFVVV
ncbi:MAG TPA: hypothetical protein DD409_03840 [Bacteroidales bacterium]|nr:hypothetical protein [Bacteroidales bacterium]